MFMVIILCFLAAISSNMSINSVSARSGGTSTEDDYRSSLDPDNRIPNVSQNLSNHNNLHQKQHFCINATTKVFDCSLITCTSDGANLASGYCATYSESTRSLSIANCPYFQPLAKGFHKTEHGKVIIKLPRNLSTGVSIALMPGTGCQFY